MHVQPASTMREADASVRNSVSCCQNVDELEESPSGLGGTDVLLRPGAGGRLARLPGCY